MAWSLIQLKERKKFHSTENFIQQKETERVGWGGRTKFEKEGVGNIGWVIIKEDPSANSLKNFSSPHCSQQSFLKNLIPLPLWRGWWGSDYGHQDVRKAMLEFLEKLLANSFALSDAEDSTFSLINRGGIADLPLLRTLLAIHQKSWVPSSLKVMDSFILVAYANLAASRTSL